MRFKLKHHRKIIKILNSFNPTILQESYAYFGGGTLLALLFDEYRQSNDIDFVCSLANSGYKNIRTFIFNNGISALFSDLNTISIQRYTIDQYGIRILINIEETAIKTEIIAEARFQVDEPIYPKWTKIPCLSVIDCFTCKLLANSDRSMDDSIESRDLIDLAVLRLQSSIPQLAIEKAEQAYEVIRPLRAAIKRFQTRPEYREKSLVNLKISPDKICMIIEGIDLLAEDMGLKKTERLFKEQPDLFI